jgi:hypothetical protein
MTMVNNNNYFYFYFLNPMLLYCRSTYVCSSVHHNGQRMCLNAGDGESSAGPNVESVLSTSPTEAARTAEPRKATIGTRRPANTAKKGVCYCYRL